MVGRLKFHGATTLAGHMAAAIVANAPPGLIDAPLVPVPGRGHAESLAKAIARRAGVPALALLARAGGRRQVGRTRADRLRAPPRFRPVRAGAGRVLLVDDVVTTGATLRQCAGALESAGWECATALVYARTPVR